MERLRAEGYEHQDPKQGEKQVTLLYFSWLVKKLRKESEQVTIPAAVTDVDALLRWLGRRRRGAAVLFEKERVRVTVNKQFSEGFTKLHDGDEIGIVPNSPIAPATPDLL